MVSHSSNKFATQIATQNKTIVLTDVAIRNLKPAEKRVTYMAQGMSGFGLRVSPSGRKVFFYKFRFNRVEYRLSLGRYPQVQLREARKKYSEASELIAKGINPAAKHKKEKSKSITVNGLIDKYEAHCLAQGKKSTKDEIRALRKDLGAVYGHQPVSEIDTDDIRAILTLVVNRSRGKGDFKKEGAPGAANHLRRYAHRMFRLAVQWGHISLNPVSPLDRPAPINQRTRVLSFQEMYRFWHGLPQTNMSLPSQRALRFMLVTMQRGIDVRSMLWSDIDHQNAVWTIPTPKNKRTWRIPLNLYAFEILKEAAETTSEFKRPFAFSKDTMMSKGVLDHHLKKELPALAMDHFTPHDLRRTWATLIASLGCPRYWVALLLNHTEGTVTDIYDQYGYDFEKRKAMNVLEFALKQILGVKSAEHVPTLEQLRELVREAKLING